MELLLDFGKLIVAVVSAAEDAGPMLARDGLDVACDVQVRDVLDEGEGGGEDVVNHGLAAGKASPVDLWGLHCKSLPGGIPWAACAWIERRLEPEFEILQNRKLA